MTSLRLFHGGVPGLGVGDLITPGHSRDDLHPGCPICAARSAGSREGIDPASAHPDRIYVTGSRDYARFHASLYGFGDLYQVESVGDLLPSPEDKVPSWTCEAARVTAVLGRRIVLTPKQRRHFYRVLAALDGIDRPSADREFARLVAQ